MPAPTGGSARSTACARFFTAPTGLRAVKQQDAEGAQIARHDLSRLDTLFLAGERCDPPTAIWIAGKLGKPVVDHWWQTETGWPITAGFAGLGLFPFKPGTTGRPAPGYDLQVLDDQGAVLPRGQTGNLAARLPLPPGCAPTLWQNDEGFRSSYLADFPGWYRTGDAGVIDADGDVSVMGRTDDVINVAGHRLSTGAMEGVLAAHSDVAECAVVGMADAVKGQVPLGLVVLKAGVDRPEEEIAAELVALVRERIGPVAAFRDARVVKRAAEDAIRQNPAQRDPPARRRRAGAGAGDDRGPGGAGRDRGHAAAGVTSRRGGQRPRMVRGTLLAASRSQTRNLHQARSCIRAALRAGCHARVTKAWYVGHCRSPSSRTEAIFATAGCRWP